MWHSLCSSSQYLIFQLLVWMPWKSRYHYRKNMSCRAASSKKAIFLVLKLLILGIFIQGFQIKRYIYFHLKRSYKHVAIFNSNDEGVKSLALLKLFFSGPNWKRQLKNLNFGPSLSIEEQLQMLDYWFTDEAHVQNYIFTYHIL